MALMNADSLQQAVLQLVRSPGYQPLKARAIARKLRVPDEQAGLVKQAVKALVRAGELAYGSGHRVQPAGPQSAPEGCAIGIFKRRESGDGWVRPRAADTGQLPRDIYIPAEAAGDASTGDLVAVRLTGQRRGRSPGVQGRIVEVLERQTHQFVGTYFEVGGQGYVQVDGTVFARPIFVGDPGARGARPDDKVVLEMIRFPTHLRDGEGVITEVLGPLGKPGVDTLSILREFQLPEQFPEDVLAAARDVAQQFDETIPPGRSDATGETVITIDPADARDFDDAISLVRTAQGGWRLGVHIADVAYFVRPKTPLDREARQRGTSVYLPDRVLPMLPELISNGVASLQPGKLRYTKSVYLDFTGEGVRHGIEVRAGAIASTRRLTYEEVDAFFADPKPWRRRWGAKVCDLLLAMRELARLLRRRRMARGALELTMPEVKVELDRSGRVTGARVVPNTESHQIIEEFMVAANEAVAESLRDRGLLFLRRVHKPPTLRKLTMLNEFVADLGLRSGDGLQSRFALQKLLGEAAGKPYEHAVNYAVLRSLQRAIYSPEPHGHFALASECYCHFTSPIRRYPDLTVHRLLDAVLAGKRPRQDFGELVALGEHCSQREERAEVAERELTRLKLLAYLNDRIGMEMDAVITGVESFGLFAEGMPLPAEGFIHVDALADDYYRYDRTARALVGYRSGSMFRLGDVIRVAVARVDMERRRLDFRLIGRQVPPTPPVIPKPPARPSAAPKRASARRSRSHRDNRR